MLVMDKRGAEVALNTVVIAIIIILVLTSVIIFFTVGFGNMSSKFRSVTKMSVEGIDLTLAINLCQQYCDVAKTLDEDARSNSPYCVNRFDIDEDGDGNADITNINCMAIGIGCGDDIGFCRYSFIDDIKSKYMRNQPAFEGE